MRQIPGVKIPDAVIKRMESSADPKEESIQITLENMQRISKMRGVRGLHLTAVGWESIVPRLVSESGLSRE